MILISFFFFSPHATLVILLTMEFTGLTNNVPDQLYLLFIPYSLISSLCMFHIFPIQILPNLEFVVCVFCRWFINNTLPRFIVLAETITNLIDFTIWHDYIILRLIILYNNYNNKFNWFLYVLRVITFLDFEMQILHLNSIFFCISKI